MSKNHKIIFTGPVGAGKTTAIQSLSDIPIISTEESASDMTKKRKKTTTVAMDYGMMKLDSGERVHLYGTPGQERFDFMWDVLTEGGIGLVMLLDNSRRNPVSDLRFFTKAFQKFIDSSYLVIGVTRMDLSAQPTIKQYQRWLDDIGLKAPVFEVDARRKDDVSNLIEALLFSLDPGA